MVSLRFRNGSKFGVQPLISEFMVFGTSTHCDFKVTGRRVSDEHCALRKKGEEYIIIDLGSENGTYVNGTRVFGNVPLRNKDRIQLGSQVFEFADEDSAHGVQSILNEMTAELGKSRSSYQQMMKKLINDEIYRRKRSESDPDPQKEQ